ncbi:MAG: winged helix-turn-helix transcriptional regulator [Candidatus Thorarchaeota archaeon]
MSEWDVKEVILHLLENKRQRGILMDLYKDKIPFSKLKKKSNISSTTLARDLKFFDSIGLIVNVFERTNEGSYSYYELNHFGKRVAQIIIELEHEVDERIRKIPV